jgi:hypothetical protein
MLKTLKGDNSLSSLNDIRGAVVCNLNYARDYELEGMLI